MQSRRGRSRPQNPPVQAGPLRTDAWLLRGISSIPGTLALAENRLRFTASGYGTAWPFQLRTLERVAARPGLAHRLDADETALVFDLPLGEVRDVSFPWYYFSGGVKLTARGVRYRFSFARPANTRTPPNREHALEVARTVGSAASEISRARRNGEAWKAALLSR